MPHKYHTKVDRGGRKTAVILTALSVEMRAVLAHLANVERVVGERQDVYSCGIFQDSSGDWFVAVMLSGQGNVAAAVSTDHALTDFRDPDIVIFLGVAGSLKSDVDIGHVVAATYAYDIEHGKVDGDGEFRSRSHGVFSSEFASQVASAVEVDELWPARVRNPKGYNLDDPALKPYRTSPRGFVAPIASGSKVITSKTSPIYQWITKYQNDAHAIEMEGFGALYAAIHRGKADAIIIRGISDLVADKKPELDHLRQPLAAAHAMAFTAEFLATLAQLSSGLAQSVGISIPAKADASEPVEQINAPSPVDFPIDATVPLFISAPAAKTAISVAVAPSSPLLMSAPAAKTAATVAKAPFSKFVLVCEGSDQEVPAETLAAIERLVQERVSNSTVRIEKVEKGSVILHFAGQGDLAEKIQNDIGLREEIGQRLAAKGTRFLTPTEYDAATHAAAAFRNISKELYAIARTLPGGAWLDRPEQETLEARVNESEPSTTALLGAPGTGKSALLARLGERLESSSRLVVAIKADTLPPSIDSPKKLGEYLNLTQALDDAVVAATAMKPVVLIIDQLDALAGYIDVSTGRLNVLLNLIRRLSGRKDVHIFVSCRSFEFEHDTRLKTVNAETLFLDLPSWAQVGDVLTGVGIQPDSIPEGAREVLRNPQTLRTFLEIRQRTGSLPLEISYHAMLERLWNDRFTPLSNSAEVFALLSNLALTMANEEALWLPASGYDGHALALQELEKGDVIVRNVAHTSIGFRHQTLFEHALARAFSGKLGQLSAYVLARQNSLFVRPKLWVSLNYLRSTHSQVYESELGTIWKNPKLRKHLRLLLVEFLGSQTDPSNFEESLLRNAEAFSVSSSKIFAAVAGSVGWFTRLKGNLVQSGMAAADRERSVLQVLARAAEFARDEVISLVVKNWLPDAKFDSLTWWVISEVPAWTEEILAVAKVVIRRTQIAGHSVEHVASQLAVSQGEMAFKLVGAYLDSALEEASSLSDRVKRTGGDNEWDSILARSPRDSRLQEIIDRNGWHHLPEIALQAPALYLQQMWPTYQRLYKLSSRPSRDGELRDVPYWIGRAIRTSGVDMERPLFAAIEGAIKETALTRPEEFRLWVRENDGSDLEVIQIHIAEGYTANAALYATDALNFLLADTRRWHLGYYSSEGEVTFALLRALVPELNSRQAAQLSQIASKYERYHKKRAESDAKLRRDISKWNRKYQQKLLSAFAPERLTAELRKRLAEDERAVGVPTEGDEARIEGGWIGSPMSADQMEKASDAAILNILTEIDDATGWDHPKKRLQGGSIQLSREFGTFAKRHPERAVEIVRRLVPEKQERPAGHAIEAMASDSADSVALGDLIQELDRKGFRKREFRELAANGLQKLASRKLAISDSLVNLLEGWLQPYKKSRKPKKSRDEEDDDDVVQQELKEEGDEREDSLLWGYGGAYTLPGGNFTILDAITSILLNKTPAAADRWREILEAHLNRGDSSVIWMPMLHRLQYLQWGEKKAGLKFLTALFKKHSDLFETRAAYLLLAHVRGWVGARLLSQWLEQVRRGSPRAQQAYGELLTLTALTQPSARWARRSLDSALNGKKRNLRVLSGIAFAAARLWTEKEFRASASGVLKPMFVIEDKRIAKAILDVFRLTDDWEGDSLTVELLEQIAAHPKLIALAGQSFLTDRLSHLLPACADQVARIARAIIEIWKDDLSNFSTGIAAASPELVDIAITLHRLDGPNGLQGLELFENLIEIDAYGARDTLAQIDSRFQISRPLRRRIRRKPRK